MSPQLLYVILLLQFHACFASRGLVFFPEKLINMQQEELLQSKEMKEKLNMHGLTLECQLKMNCMEVMERSKSDFESDLKSMKTPTRLGIDLKPKKKRVVQDVYIGKSRATLESLTPHEYDKANAYDNSDEPGEDIEVKDYAQPRRKSPIHNEKP